MPLEPTAFNRSALDLARGVLALSTHACRIAGTRRWSSADSGETVVIPEAAELARLRSAVEFTAAELAAVVGVEPDALEPIVWDLDASGAPVAVPDDTQFTARPLLRRGDSYVLVEPGSLAAAMRHALISLAVRDGMRPELVGWLGHTAVGQVVAAIERMDWRLQHRLPASDAPIVSLIAGFDTDKAANVVILYEDLDGYDPDDPFTSWDARKWETALEHHLRRMEEGLMLGPGQRPNELLHVVILAGSGRPSVFGLPAPAPPLEAPHLLMSVENLDRISMGEHDPLTLWKYAGASARVRRGCHVVAFGPLDEFAAWSEQQSYYMGDDGRPTMILSTAPTGGTSARRWPARPTCTASWRRTASGSRWCGSTAKSTSRSTRTSTTSAAGRCSWSRGRLSPSGFAAPRRTTTPPIVALIYSSSTASPTGCGSSRPRSARPASPPDVRS
jgi:hypothetical protein